MSAACYIRSPLVALSEHRELWHMVCHFLSRISLSLLADEAVFRQATCSAPAWRRHYLTMSPLVSLCGIPDIWNVVCSCLPRGSLKALGNEEVFQQATRSSEAYRSYFCPWSDLISFRIGQTLVDDFFTIRSYRIALALGLKWTTHFPT